MKTTTRIGLITVLIVVTFSCTKEKIVTQVVTKNIVTQKASLSDSLALILAGAKGSSKSWKIVSISRKVNSDATQTVTGTGIPTCEADNIFQFTNNFTQNYVQTEGTTMCDSNRPDPTTVEKGSWAFTGDGKGLLVDTWVYPSSAQFQDPNEPFLGYLILSEGQSLMVITLTETNSTFSYSYIYNSDTYLITLKFVKI